MEEVMKKSMVVFITLAVLATGGAALAATTTVVVSATVVGTCQFNNAGTIAFGTLNQVGAPLVTGTVTQPAFWCTNNAGWTMTDDSGVNKLVLGVPRMTNGTDFIPYTFTYTASGSGAGKTTPTTMNIAATIPAGSYSDVSAGSYADTVTLTIIP
jgi:spore coat protein U-like protein